MQSSRTKTFFGAVLCAGLLAGAALGVHGPAAAGPVTIEGYLERLWHCGGAPGEAPSTSTFLVDDAGRRYPLAPGASGLNAIAGTRSSSEARVHLQGRFSAAIAGAQPLFHVQSFKPDPAGLPAPSAVAATDPRPMATLLLRFADTAGSTPKQRSYFTNLFGSNPPELNDYFLKASYGQFSLEGGQVVDWLNLPKPRSAYRQGSLLDFKLLIADAVAVADNQVAFGDFVGINFMFNSVPWTSTLDGVGGRLRFVADGVNKSWGVTFCTKFDQGLVAHEIGHTYGMTHSSGAYGEVYDSKWDVMSSACNFRHPTYQCTAVGPTGYNLRRAEFLAADAIDDVRGREITIFVTATTRQAGPGAKTLARLFLDSAGTKYYSVEARVKEGYDNKLTGEGVLIHKVDEVLDESQAKVVDPDKNGNPNDAAAIFAKGEKFRDAGTDVEVQVLDRIGPTFKVRLRNKPVNRTTLSISDVAADGITLSWQDVSGETGYVLERRPADAPGATVSTSLAAGTASFKDTTVVAGDPYIYRLKVLGDAVFGFSNEVGTSAQTESPGELKITPAALNYKKVKLGKSKKLRLTLRNIASEGTLIGKVFAPEAPFVMPSGTVSFSLTPGQSKVIDVLFQPLAKGAVTGSLAIESSDPARLDATVALKGAGK